MADEKQLVVNLALKAGTMKQQITSINKDIKQMQTDFKNAGAGIENFEKTSEGLSKKLKLQQSVLDKLKEKLNVYKKEQEKCTETLDKAVSAYKKQEEKVKSLERVLEEAKDTYGKSSKEVKELEEQLKKANKTLETKRNSVINANNSLKNMKTTISSTETEIKGMERQINQTSNTLDNLEDGLEDVGETANDTNSKFSKLGDGLKSFASKIGSITLGLAKVGGALVAAGATLAGTLTKLSIDAYAEYEQLVGGIDTLFKDSSYKVQEYANNAYKTAGLSANDYMETVTAFSASLLQGLGGDTEKAAELSNQAITDMSDNANKMGTTIDSIINAYQGFAKQNYTMLDNLKLGYGGTKEEMARLINDTKVLGDVMVTTGQKGNFDEVVTFDKVIEAIHIVQDQLGITGTTALEASTTIEGSLNATKSAWTNLISGMANENANFDQLINNLVDSASTFGENILPRIEIAIKGLGQLIEKLLPPIVERIPQLITDVLPSLINAGVQMVGSLGSGLIQALPQLIDCAIQAIETIIQGLNDNMGQVVDGAMQIISALVDGLIQLLPMLLEVGLNLILTLAQGLADNASSLIPTIVELMITLCDMIINNLPMLIDVALDIIVALAEGLIEALPTLIAEVPRIINSFCDTLYSKLPDIIKTAWDLIVMFTKGLIDSIPVIIENLPQIIMAIVNVISLYNWSQLGKNLIEGIGNGIKSMVGSIKDIAKSLADGVVNAIKGIFTSNGGSIGKNFITFISNGISSMFNGITSVASSLGNGVINVFKTLFSPSKMFDIGKELIKGIWNGISSMKDWIINLIGGFAGSVISSIKSFFKIEGKKSANDYNSQYGNQVYSLNDTLGFANLKLDNIALSGSYYTPQARDSLNANDVINRVNGASQSVIFDKMLNTVNNTLLEMAKTIQELKANSDRDIVLYNTNNTYLDEKLIANETTKQVISNVAKTKKSRRILNGGGKLKYV